MTPAVQILDPSHLWEVWRGLAVITDGLVKGSALSHALVHTLAVAMSEPTRTRHDEPPSLASVLERQPVWAEVGTIANSVTTAVAGC